MGFHTEQLFNFNQPVLLNNILTLSITGSIVGAGTDASTATLLPPNKIIYYVNSPDNVNNTGVIIDSSNAVPGRVLIIANDIQAWPTDTHNKNVIVYPPLSGTIDMNPNHDLNWKKTSLFICLVGGVNNVWADLLGGI